MESASILTDIITKKRADLAAAKRRLPLAELRRRVVAAALPTASTASRFAAGIDAGVNSTDGLAIIAEIKLASPTHPALGSAAEILDRAAAYQAAGADAISFITEPHYFKGEQSYIPKLKQRVKLPILQKDFVIDQYQVYESRLAGADALLLIAGLLEHSELQRLVALTQELGIEPVVEITDAAERDKAISTPTRFIAVNARDLRTFTLDLPAACKLLRTIPERFTTLGFSGITSRTEVEQYQAAGARGVLVGTSLMQAADISRFLASLRA